MPKRNPLAPRLLSEDTILISMLGQFGLANYKMGSNENKGKPNPDDIKTVEQKRNEFLDYLDKQGAKKK